ncbi:MULTISPECIES: hypothetical protein [Pseudoalteromonas]|uniref:Uncharacterized protein n=1 Tax=Pseudoalteromonas rubra TaxID=43658 RepID=A0A5S3V5X7_9GAMM|nr:MULTISPECIES: hypothetical protein [Pseudoalteromonas]MCG7562863.1 hypothetical protein [Pseudoalteromonas sp. McH1-42]MEC4089156.1 hypothetical protein [Pseudoalteromonas rubra]QPB83348.1 hypothetical protein CWC22_010240 [Pseudoalteromonas rubra]
MGNLFLKERENWWTWIVWGVLGCISTGIMLPHISEVWLALLSPACFLLILTSWMSYSRRFDFSRAFKVLSCVAVMSVIPVLLENLHPVIDPTQGIVDMALVILMCVGLSVIGAWVARRPKQYY